MCPNWTKALNLAKTKTSKEDVLFHVPPSVSTHLSRYTLLVPADPAVSLSSARDVENTRSWIGTAHVCHTHVCLPAPFFACSCGKRSASAAHPGCNTRCLVIFTMRSTQSHWRRKNWDAKAQAMPAMGSAKKAQSGKSPAFDVWVAAFGAVFGASRACRRRRTASLPSSSIGGSVLPPSSLPARSATRLPLCRGGADDANVHAREAILGSDAALDPKPAHHMISDSTESM